VSGLETAYSGAVNNRNRPRREVMFDRFVLVNGPFKDCLIKQSGY